MRICLLSCLFLLLCSGEPCAAAERSPIYPFDVTTGDEAASLEGSVHTAIFARLKNPVTKDAVVKLGIKEPTMIITNVFRSDAKGVMTQKDQANAKIIMVQSGTEFSLDKAMDGKPLEPGTYAMNIVVRELGTSRVLFEVKGDATSPGTTSTNPKVDSSDPAAVLQAVFDAARSGDHSQLATLGSSGPDGDVQMILGVPKGDEKIKTMFVTFFGKGKVVGTPRIQGDKAEVDFLFGPDGKKPETMNLIKEGGQWRLHSF